VPIIKDEEVNKRNRNMFGNLMGYLKRAKENLETQEPIVRRRVLFVAENAAEEF
jgi:hypothetical protein